MPETLIHIYFMAPLKPSPTQLRAQTLCKLKVPPAWTASEAQPATCELCILKGRELRQKAAAELEEAVPQSQALADYVSKFDALLDGSAGKEVCDG